MSEVVGLSAGDDNHRLGSSTELPSLDSLSLDTVYDASIELEKLRSSPDYERPFKLKAFSSECDVELDQSPESSGIPHLQDSSETMEAKVKVKIGDKLLHEVCEGNGPVNSLDNALKKALNYMYPHIVRVRPCSYKVNIDDPESATAAITVVEIQAEFEGKKWFSIGRSTNIIKASALALSDLYELYLHKCNSETPTNYTI